MLYVIVNTGQKIHGTKFLPTRTGGEIGENFLLAAVQYNENILKWVSQEIYVVYVKYAHVNVF